MTIELLASADSSSSQLVDQAMFFRCRANPEASYGEPDTPKPRSIWLGLQAGLDPSAVVCEILNEDWLDGSIAPTLQIQTETRAKNLLHPGSHSYRRKREKTCRA